MSPTSIMPKYELPEPDLRALAEFMLALDFNRAPARNWTREQALALSSPATPTLPTGKHSAEAQRP